MGPLRYDVAAIIFLRSVAAVNVECAAGTFRNSSGACELCPPGSYKPSPGDEACTGFCLRGSTTQPGARDARDCFCVKGTRAIVDETDTLQECANCIVGEGLECPGGFETGEEHGTVQHARPYALPGYFQIRADRAIECPGQGYQSPCRGGFDCRNNRTRPGCVGPWGNTCREDSFGFGCRECSAGWFRDAREYVRACRRCPSSFQAFTQVVVGTLWQVVFSLGIAFMAARAAYSSKALHSAMIRIGMQWVSVMSLVGCVDLELLGSDPGNVIQIMKHSLPNIAPPYELFQCLAESLFPGQQAAKRLLHMALLVLYPLVLFLVTVALSGAIVYVLCPVCDRLGARFLMKGWLKAKLVSKGCSEECADAVVADCGQSFGRMMALIQERPEFWSDVRQLMLKIGSAATEEIVRHQMHKALRPYIPRLDESQTRRMNEVLEEMSLDQMDDIIMNPTYFIAMLKMETDSPLSRGVLARGMVCRFTDEMNADHGPVAQPPIMGLFSDRPNLKTMVWDSLPVVLIAWYSEWDYIVSCSLQMFSCIPFHEGGSDTESLNAVWRLRAYPDVQCFATEHRKLLALGIVSLSFWGLAMPFALFMWLLRLRGERHSPAQLRRFGFFIQGFQPSYWWWDIIVKRLDMLFMFAITNFDFQGGDEQTKLILYSFGSGFVLSLQNSYSPYDRRRCGLLDAIESWGMMVRFTFFAVLAIVVGSGPHKIFPTFCIVLALLVVMLFVAYFMLHLIMIYCEQLGTRIASFVDREGGEDEVLVQRRLTVIRKQRCIARLVQHVAQKFAKLIDERFQRRRRLTFHLKWLGPGVVEGCKPNTSGLGWLGAAIWWLQRRSEAQEQRAFAGMFARFLSLWMTHFSEFGSCLPHRMLDVLLVLATAAKRLTQHHRAVNRNSLRDEAKKVIARFSDQNRRRMPQTDSLEVFSDDIVVLVTCLSSMRCKDVPKLVKFVSDILVHVESRAVNRGEVRLNIGENKPSLLSDESSVVGLDHLTEATQLRSMSASSGWTAREFSGPGPEEPLPLSPQFGRFRSDPSVTRSSPISTFGDVTDVMVRRHRSEDWQNVSKTSVGSAPARHARPPMEPPPPSNPPPLLEPGQRGASPRSAMGRAQPAPAVGETPLQGHQWRQNNHQVQFSDVFRPQRRPPRLEYIDYDPAVESLQLQMLEEGKKPDESLTLLREKLREVCEERDWLRMWMYEMSTRVSRTSNRRPAFPQRPEG